MKSVKEYKPIIKEILLLETLKEQYEAVYDLTCKDLDKQFKDHNFCDFKNNQCIAHRHLGNTKTMGCCNTRGSICPYLKNEQCSINCISCKLFTCNYLKRKGINFKVRNNPLLKRFFNKKQLLVLTNNLFHDKDVIIQKLLKTKQSKMPFIIFYLLNKEIIKNEDVNLSNKTKHKILKKLGFNSHTEN